MPRIPEEVINDIRNKARIEDVIGHYISVIRKGNSYVAMCPFHEDHDPSMHINSDKQIFKCFSCPAEEGSAGDVFKFVMKYKHVSYLQAVQMVAELIGYEYDFSAYSAKDEFVQTSHHRIMEDAVLFCSNELNSQRGLFMLQYLKKRQLSDAIIEKFEFGYNPGNNELFDYLSRKGYDSKDIVAVNLARLSDRGVRDVFFNRLMIPIHDRTGHPIGFTARTLDPNVDSKYINSTETPLFHKSDVVFNYHRALDSAREKKYVILAEGPMDVIGFARAGMNNAVCCMGTACTQSQLKQISTLSKKLVLAYDGDKAGQGATFRTGKMALSMGFEVAIINNPSTADPDEIVNGQGGEALKKMVEKPVSWMQWLMDYYKVGINLNDYTALKEYALKLLPEIKALPQEFDRNYYLERLSEITKISVEVLSGAQSSKTTNVTSVSPVKAKVKNKGIILAQRMILKNMLLSVAGANIYREKLYSLPDKAYNDLAIYIIDYYFSHSEMDTSQFMATLPNDGLKATLKEIIEDEMLADSYSQNVLDDAIRKIKSVEFDEKIKAKMAEMNKYSDPNVKAKVAAEYVQLQLEKKKFLDGGNS